MMNPEHTKSPTVELASVAQQLIDGKIGVSYASRLILGHASRAYGDPWKNEIFRIFVVIESDTDHLPLGSVRSKWDSEALKKKDEEIAGIDDFYRAEAIKAAKTILEFLKK